MTQKFFEWHDSSIPQHTQVALENYFVHGYEPGGFVTSMLANDLNGAVNRADMVNRTAIFEISRWVQRNAPQGSWGSIERVEGWLAGNEHRRQFEKQVLLKVLAS